MLQVPSLLSTEPILMLNSVLFQTEITEVQQVPLKIKPLYLLELFAILKIHQQLKF